MTSETLGMAFPRKGKGWVGVVALASVDGCHASAAKGVPKSETHRAGHGNRAGDVVLHGQESFAAIRVPGWRPLKSPAGAGFTDLYSRAMPASSSAPTIASVFQRFSLKEMIDEHGNTSFGDTTPG
jgi:hypothetical protein